MTESKQKIRVQFDFAQDAYDELTELQDAVRASSKAETIRYALRTLQWVVAAAEENKRILTDDGESLREVVFPFIPQKSPGRKERQELVGVRT